tara:strand:+ start:1328 stop:1534 length:207 start_codon:yes stop_codon:yes gene_type:complete
MSNDFNMFHGERVRYDGKHPLLKDEEGIVVGGDAHQFVIKWDNLEVLRGHSPYDIVWLPKKESEGYKN